MGSPYEVTINIGGQLASEDVPAFIEAAQDDGFGLDWEWMLVTVEALDECLKGKDASAPLQLTNGECNYGQATELLEFCRAHGLSYCYYCQPDHGEAGEIRQWMAGAEDEIHHGYDGETTVISLESLVGRKEQGESLDDVIAWLTRPELPAFSVEGHFCTLTCETQPCDRRAKKVEREQCADVALGHA